MKVAVAVIFDEQQRVLITKRPEQAAHGGLWEFPGGKLEKEETAEAALIREIKEEVDLDILDYTFLGAIYHTYGINHVELLVFSSHQFKGEAHCREGQSDLRWVHRQELDNYDFPEANEEVKKLIMSELSFN